MSLTKKDLADKINQAIGISKLKSTELVESFFEGIKEGLKRDKVVKLTHFGTFKLREKNARMGRNPKTKESAVISARKTVSFNSTTKLKNKVNKKSV